MIRNIIKRPLRKPAAVLAAFALILAFSVCRPRAAWEAKNDRLIKEHGLKGRVRSDIPKTGPVPNLEAGAVANFEKLTETQLAPGVTARLYWGRGVLVGWLRLEPGAEMPRETLPAERIMVVVSGSVSQILEGGRAEMIARDREPADGTHGATPRNDFVYLGKGAPNGLKAGPAGAYVLEVYSPPRLDYLTKAGATGLPPSLPEAALPLPPTVEAGRIYDLYDLQLTELSPGANSRLIAGRGAQLSFLTMNPGSVFDLHIHPEEQVMSATRGSIEERILDGSAPMNKGDLLLLPGNMVHGGANGPHGCDALDVFWPPRPDYTEKMEKRLAAFHAVIPAEARVELVADGSKTEPQLVFAEGPSWLGGKLYFSSMGFDQGWNGDIKKSSVIEMGPDGTLRTVSAGRMLTNGTKPLPNGNLAVCDMFGHRIVEMTTRGEIVRTIAGRYEGKPLDGPNDLIYDSKGGLYFSDPQFTADPVKNQPGKCVYYLSPQGKLTRVIEPGTYGMPNGLALSPDGKTLFIDNTFDEPGRDTDKDNFIWAYDVREDGTLANERKFAELFLTPEVLDAGTKSTSADGMTIDSLGNLYVCTYAGLQIFNAKGEFVGIVNFPVFPVNCCFGGEDLKTLHVVAYNKVYRIRTNAAGLGQTSAARR
jgi:gluconolactonase